MTLGFCPRWTVNLAQPSEFSCYSVAFVCRCNLWGDGTIPRTEEPAQISHQDPAFAAGDPRTPVFIAFAKAIQQINPKVKVIGTVRSPPAWMKENNSITDTFSGAALGETYRSDKGELTNRVKKEYYPHFVKWLVEMAKHYASQGVPLYAVSPANEPQFTQTFESCVWTPKDLLDIIAMLGAELEKAGMGQIKIVGPESMTGFNWQGGPNRLFAQHLEANPAALKALSFFATHGYEDGFKADVTQNSSAQFWNLIEQTGKPCWVFLDVSPFRGQDGGATSGFLRPGCGGSEGRCAK